MQLVKLSVCCLVLRQFLQPYTLVGVEMQQLIDAARAANAAAAEAAAAKAAEKAARRQAKAEAAAAAAAGLEQPEPAAAAAAGSGERVGTSSGMKRSVADTAADTPPGKRAAVDLAASDAALGGGYSDAAQGAEAIAGQQQAAGNRDDNT
jgi:hypothetical protein